jgi:serralysin
MLLFSVMTIPDKSAEKEKGKVTYVLDQDLVRFGKFAIAMLGIFVAVGTYLFGIKLELTVEKMKASQETLRKSEDTLEEQRKKSSDVQKKLDSAAATAEELLREMRERNQASETMFASLKVIVLNTQERNHLERLKEQSPDRFRGQNQKLWPPGATLTVRFLAGTSEKQSFFKRAMEEWLRYANLKVVYTDALEAEIRVAFSPEGSYSYCGTDALVTPKDDATLNLDLSGSDLDMPVALHEVGQMLGLVKEYKNPKANILWNRAHMYSTLEGAPNYWTKEQVQVQFFGRVDYPGSRDFDPKSIMMYSIPADFLTSGKGFEMQKTLSDSDKEYISKLYPH